MEIINLLDKDAYSGEELRQNYAFLTEKWGEWEIIGQDSAGIVIRYVNVGKAFFSGMAILFIGLTFISLVISITVGKIIFPLLKKHYDNTNNELVDIATLQSAAQIAEMHENKKVKKDKVKKSEEWF